MIRGDTFGARFRAARLDRGYSQDVLADLLGITKAAVSQWELDNKSPRFELWPAICRVLGASLDELILGVAYGHTANMVREPAANPYAAHPPRLQRLMQVFTGLDDAQQRMLVDMAKLFAQQNAQHADEIADAEAAAEPDGPDSEDPD